MSEAERAEASASEAVERRVARTIGRPLGALAGVVGFGMGIAALGAGHHAAAVGWFTLGSFGFAMFAVGGDAAASSS